MKNNSCRDIENVICDLVDILEVGHLAHETFLQYKAESICNEGVLSLLMHEYREAFDVIRGYDMLSACVRLIINHIDQAIETLYEIVDATLACNAKPALT